jgi:hypothetical protein
VSLDPFDKGRARVLTDEQRDYLAGWVREVADMLALRDWRIFVSPFDAEKDSHATSWIANRYDEQWIAVGRRFFDESPDERRETLMHELLHPHFYRVTRLGFDLVERELGTRTEAVIETAVEVAEELAIDRLARAIAGFFPAVELPEAA